MKLGREGRDCGEGHRARSTRWPGVQAVADPQTAGIDQTDDVARPGFVDGVPVGPEHRRRVLGGEGPGRSAVRQHHASLEASGAHPDERNTIAMGRVHICLNLEDEPGELRIQSPGRAVDIGDRRRPGRQIDHGVQEMAHPEVRQRRAHEQRAGSPGQKALHIQAGADLVEEGALLHGVRPGVAQLRVRGRGRGRHHPLRGRARAAASRSGKADKGPIPTIDDPSKVAGFTDRPRHGRGYQADLLFDLVEQLQRGAPGPIQLVEERQDWQPPGMADLKQLAGLRLDPLGDVKDHDGRVRGGEYPVSVLREVPVTGGVQQVDDALAVGELQDGGGDRDAALLLQRHPVRCGPPAPGPGSHGSRFLHGARVQQELLGQGGLPGVGMADDREGAPAGCLGRGRV